MQDEYIVQFKCTSCNVINILKSMGLIRKTWALKSLNYYLLYLHRWVWTDLKIVKVYNFSCDKISSSYFH